MLAIVFVLLNRSVIDKDPNAVRWVLAVVIADVCGYVFGTVNGIREFAQFIVDEISPTRGPGEESGKMGGEGDRHEE